MVPEVMRIGISRRSASRRRSFSAGAAWLAAASSARGPASVGG